MSGAFPDGPGSRASHEAASASSPKASIPNARRAWLDVNEAFLREALLLPPGCKILDVMCGDNNVVGLLVEHEAIHPDAMRVTAIYEKDWDGPRFVDWKITAKRQPLNVSALREFGAAEAAWSAERAATVNWLRLVSKARDDRADPEWAAALAEAAEYIEKGVHLNYFNSGAEPYSAIHSAGRPEPGESANPASAIDARRAETQGGSVADESAVAESETPIPSSARGEQGQ